jgi:Zn finger protein HypA/HybF involved in hydrogenase expression
MKNSIKWCWKCQRPTVQKPLDTIYKEHTWALIRFECLKCKSHNPKIVEVHREKES